MVTVTESCPCGARVALAAPTGPAAVAVLAGWRHTHQRHAPAPASSTAPAARPVLAPVPARLRAATVNPR